MHDVSLGTVILDYLTGNPVEKTTYEDLRQALAVYFVERLGFEKNRLAMHVPVRYTIEGSALSRSADLIVYGEAPAPLQPGHGQTVGESSALVPPVHELSGQDPALGQSEGELSAHAARVPYLMALFCQGQVATYKREAMALARLMVPLPCPFVLLTDWRESLFFEACSGAELGNTLGAVPSLPELQRMIAGVERTELSAEAREKESRILHAYTGLLKTCCGDDCCIPLPKVP